MQAFAAMNSARSPTRTLCRHARTRILLLNARTRWALMDKTIKNVKRMRMAFFELIWQSLQKCTATCMYGTVRQGGWVVLGVPAEKMYHGV